jgi:hypothetical protein
MCVQISEETLKSQLTTSELNQAFLNQKKATKLAAAPATFEEIPQGKIVVADMTGYTNIHIVTGPADLSHLKGFKADFYVVDEESIRGLF